MEKVFLALAVACLLMAMVLRTEWGSSARDLFYTNRHCCDFSLWQAVVVTWDEVVRGRRYPSQIGQDKWVLYRMYPGVSDGFFLEIGSADGTIRSNSKALEEHGWRGICIDPSPTGMEGRTCQVFTEVLWSVSGHTVQFHSHGELSGVADTLGKWKGLAAASPTVELKTLTVGDVLERAKAPAFIHFMSIDVEGAELEVLKGVPFDRYRFGAIAIEHNHEEPKRSEMVALLAGHGYVRVFTRLQDDFFAPAAASR